MIIEKLESLSTNTLRKIFFIFLFGFGLTGSIILKYQYAPYNEHAYEFINLIFALSAFFSILFGNLYFKRLEKKE